MSFDNRIPQRRKAILEFEEAKKTMEVKMEAEKFRVGRLLRRISSYSKHRIQFRYRNSDMFCSKVRLLERKVLNFQWWIAIISGVSIVLAILVQEIEYYGTYSDRFGGQWFDPEPYEVGTSLELDKLQVII